MRYDFNAISAGKRHKWHRNSSEFWRHNGRKNRRKCAKNFESKTGGWYYRKLDNKNMRVT